MLARLQAVIFDLDGVVTDTAGVHAAAWRRLFDEYNDERAARGEPRYAPFDPDGDYRRHLDGRPRHDGVAGFLASRGVDLDVGAPDDPPDRETVCGLGNRKNDYFRAALERAGVTAFGSTVALVRALRARGVATAVISSSRNAAAVLEAAGLDDLFVTRVDGVDSAERSLPGKPDPAIFLEAARRLGVAPRDAAVVEDALAGVEAGKAGGFALVVGVDRTGDPDALTAAGADVVVGDLGELTVPAPPSALDRRDEIAARLAGRTPAVFLDHDGTLSPIVDDPDAAVIPDRTRAALVRLAATVPTAIVSGRDLSDLRARVGIDTLVYAGSHGFEIAGPPGREVDHQRGEEFLPALDAADSDLDDAVGDIPGVAIERKRFAIAVHYRRMDEAAHGDRLRRAVEEVAARHPGLRVTGGKKILELRPELDWDKGRAVAWLLDALGLTGDAVVPIYLGDDVTDEDVFVRLGDRGIGVVVDPGHRLTAAQYTLPDLEAVTDFLEGLAEGTA